MITRTESFNRLFRHQLAEEQPEAVVAQIVAFADRHGRRLAPV